MLDGQKKKVQDQEKEKIDDEEQNKSRVSMKRVKERRDLEFPEQISVSMHNLRNNAFRFRKESEIRNLILEIGTKQINRKTGCMKQTFS